MKQMKILIQECMFPKYCKFFEVVEVICFTLWTMMAIMPLS